MELSFGEQIKILLNRNHMTIQDLANRYEAVTGNKMSRQNLTQRLKRDNFPEQDMHVIASLLGCRVSIQVDPIAAVPVPEGLRTVSAEPLSAPEGLPAAFTGPASTAEGLRTAFTESAYAAPGPVPAPAPSQPDGPDPDDPKALSFAIPEAFRRQEPQGDINPLTGMEYLTNTVRRHPDRPGYIQVYDQNDHSWSDVQENYFWEFQQRKKQMLGSDYQEPLLI